MNLQNQLDFLPTLLDGVVLPAPLDPDLMRSQIMLDCGLLTPLYSEPDTMKTAIQYWFAARSWTFEHLIKIILAEYNPIENYDRNEKYKRTNKQNRDISETNSGTDTTERSVKGDVTSVGEVSAYNSGSWENASRSVTTDGQTITTDLEHGKKIKTDDDLDASEDYEGRTHGNIGVTTTQQMLEQEIALLNEFNVYEWISKEFQSDLMLSVY